MSDSHKTTVVIDPSNMQHARIESPATNVIGAHVRIHGNPILGNESGNNRYNSVVDNNENTKSNNTVNSDNKSPPHLKGDENKLDLYSADQNVIRDHAEIVGSPILGNKSGNKSGNSIKIDDESNDCDKKVGGTTGR